MLSAKELKNITCDSNITTRSIEQLIMAAQINNINYVFLDRNTVSSDLLDELRHLGYTVIVGQGEVSRIKISW